MKKQNFPSLPGATMDKNFGATCFDNLQFSKTYFQALFSNAY